MAEIFNFQNPAQGMEYGFNAQLYPSQYKFIADAVNIVRNRQIGILSSPTGTGKTLSLLCTALTFMGKAGEDDLYALLSTESKTIIYYCSRTHTQLSQALRELSKNTNAYKSVILGSRRQYCVNSAVNKIADINILNDRCKRAVTEGSCSFYDGFYYNDSALDIEELKKRGREEVFCPYYYAKNKASECEIVFLPYNLLFTKEGRLSLGIDLENKILIVDEAHNIYDTVVDLNSAELSWSDLNRISHMSGFSNDLCAIIGKLLLFHRHITGERILTVEKFLIESKLEHYNMLNMDEHIIEDRLAQKNDFPVIFEFSKFLKYLTLSDRSGRVVFDKHRIRFTPLDPGMYFQELLRCRSVIMAGGTMEPTGLLTNIFPSLKYFNYPPVNDHFLPLIITKTVAGNQIRLVYNERDSQIDGIVNTLIALTNPLLSGGVVIFVQSRQILQMIQNSPKSINFKRTVYYESTSTFEMFQKDPQILVAVMGGRLSEGINFSDDLCRLLVVVGVPFASASLELSERNRWSPQYSILAAMRTVNQALGRAVRHSGDFAAMVLLDVRYVELQSKLSPWIAQKIRNVEFGVGLGQIHRFLRKYAQSPV